MKWNSNSSAGILLCAIGLVVAFFLDWVDLGFATASGFELASDQSLPLFLIPLLAVVTIKISFSETSNRIIGGITGATTLTLIGYGSMRLQSRADELGAMARQLGAGDDASVSITEFFGLGIWLSIALGAVLVVWALRGANHGSERSSSSDDSSNGAPHSSSS